MGKLYGVGIVFVLFLIVVIVIISVTSIFLLNKPIDDSSGNVTPIPRPPNGGGTTGGGGGGGGTPPPITPIGDLSDVYFEFNSTTPVYGITLLYLRLETLADFGIPKLVRDIHIANNSTSGYNESYKFKLDSSNNLLDNNSQYVNLSSQNVISFTPQRTINTIRYDSVSKKFLNQDGTKKLADVQGSLGINNIPYRVMNWVANDSNVDNRYTNIANIRASITPTPPVGIKSQNVTDINNIGVGTLTPTIYLDISSSTLTLKCKQFLNIQNQDKEKALFYIDNNDRILVNITSFSYVFLGVDDVNLATYQNPNVFSLYLTKVNETSPSQRFVIKTISPSSGNAKYLNIPTIYTTFVLNNICPSINWSDSITNTSYVFIFRNDLYSFPFNKPVGIKTRENNKCLNSRTIGSSFEPHFGECGYFPFRIDLSGQIVSSGRINKCLEAPTSFNHDGKLRFESCNGTQRWAINQNDNEGYYNIYNLSNNRTNCIVYFPDSADNVSWCTTPFVKGTQFEFR
jgi:hypothetical protein